MAEHTFLPSVHSAYPLAGQSDMVPKAQAFADVWLRLLGERGKAMRMDSRLVAAAQRQADWLQAHDFTPGHPHWGEGGITANARVREAGYRLPGWHGIGNTVESAARSGSNDMEYVVSHLMNHDTHYKHMHCLEFWEPNYFYGVGYAGGFYVCVTAPPPE